MLNVKEIKQDRYFDNFPKLLRDLMEKYNVKQEDLAKYVGVTRQTISSYKDGNNLPDIYIFQKIVKFFEDKYKVNYTYDFWLGNLKMKSESKYSNPISFKELGLSSLAYSNLYIFGNQPEKEVINLILENEDLIQLLQDYLGNKYRNAEHLALAGTEEILNNMVKSHNFLEMGINKNFIYDKIKLEQIIKYLEYLKYKK